MQEQTQKSHRVAVVGAGGRMGRMLVQAVLESSDCILTGALDLPDSPLLGQDAAAFLGVSSGVLVSADVRGVLAQSDVLIDFTRPEGTMVHLSVCQELGVAMVIGTTGFSPQQKQQLQAASESISLVLSPNMSVGVNVTLKLLEMAGRALAKGYDIEIIEAHHRHKVDAPSGTALKMGEVVAQAAGRQLENCAVYERYGHTGARQEQTIGFSTVRGGDIIGDHTVMFAGVGERIEISHKSSSRSTYAEGSLRAVRFLSDKKQGFYDMFDVLGLKDAVI